VTEVALTRRFGDLDIAEEAAAEEFAPAVGRWPAGRRTSQPRRSADHPHKRGHRLVAAAQSGATQHDGVIRPRAEFA
jgi:hypothetical protein